MGAVRKLMNIAQQAPKNEAKPDKGKDKPNSLQSAFHAFGDWITSPGGIVTILAVVALVLYVNHKTAKK